MWGASIYGYNILSQAYTGTILNEVASEEEAGSKGAEIKRFVHETDIIEEPTDDAEEDATICTTTAPLLV